MSTTAIWIIAIILLLAFVGALGGMSQTFSNIRKGGNWGRKHMHDMGLDDTDDDLKPF